MTRLLETIKTKTLLCDGAMGTQLQLAGLESGGCGELWNINYPERILKIQRAYVDAGVDCLITNTFGGSRIMLERHLERPDVAEINRQGAKLARQAFGDKQGFVFGDIGPFGGLLEPYGEYPQGQVYEAFLEQAEALVAEGVDAIIIETQTVLDELAVAIAAAKAAKAPCIIASMAFDLTNETKEIRTMMGTDPEQAAEFINSAGADIIALNCGAGIDMLKAAEVIKRYKQVCDLPVMAQPNAGQPVLEGTKVIYNQTPKLMVEDACHVLHEGVNIIGACCGSTPEHIRLLRNVIA